MVQRTLFFSIFFLSTLCLFFSFLYKNRGEWTHELAPLWENQLVYGKKQNSVIGLHIGWYINWQKKERKNYMDSSREFGFVSWMMISSHPSFIFVLVILMLFSFAYESNELLQRNKKANTSCNRATKFLLIS